MKPSIDYSRELEAMTKFSHEKYVDCFVKCHGWYMSEDTVFIAMEYLEHGDLNRYLYQPLPEDQVKSIVLQLAEGLVHMHDNGFAHRDLKPLNILVHKPGPDWWVKIGDFGISKRSEEENTALRTAIGTRDYMAPELKGLVHSQGSSESNEFSYTFAVDMWALGELTFGMVTQRPAFPDPNVLVNYVLRGHPFPLSALEAMGASSDCCDFINKSMIADPGNRLTASEACRHPWLQLSRPSSRASSASSKTKSEEPILSPNSSIQNGHLTAIPSKPQLANLFENSAEWSEYSTRLQEPQASQSTSPFDNTAQWSTSTQDHQHSQLTNSFHNTAKWSTGKQGSHSSHSTILRDNIAKLSTGSQRAPITQAVQSWAEGRLEIPSLDSLSLNESKAPVTPPVTIDASLVNARPTSTPLGSSSDSQMGFQGHNGFLGKMSKEKSSSELKAAVMPLVTTGTSLVNTRLTSTTPSSSSDPQTGFHRHNGFQGRISGEGSLFDSKAAMKRPVTASTSLVNIQPTSTPLGSSGDSRMGYQRHNGFQGKISGKGSFVVLKKDMKRPATAGTSWANIRSTSTPLGSSGDSQMGYHRHNGFQGKTSR